jgi:phthiocerol/phenolphthiocerol synthesis type-I polyketide synthase E
MEALAVWDGQAGTVTQSTTTTQIAMTGNEAERQIVRIWQDLLRLDFVGLDQDYFDLGGDSSLAVQMFAEIEKTLGVKLPLATLYDAPTIEQLARIVRGEAESSGWSALVKIQPEGSRPPFFCMHGAGGTVLMYRDLSRHLGTDQPFYGLQSQALDGSSPPLTTIEEMANLYAREIRKAQPHGPYFIGGYCMGGTVAFEVARQLQRDGETVALLALFDTMNWHKVPLTIWTRTSHAIQRVFFHTANFFSLDSRGKAKFLKEELSILRSRIPVWRGLVLTGLGKRQPAHGSDLLLLGQIWRANDSATWNYVPKSYPGLVTDIRPKTQYRVFSMPGLKWDEIAEGGVEITVLPVYPAGMLVEPFVQHLAVALRRSIDAAMLHCETAPRR